MSLVLAGVALLIAARVIALDGNSIIDTVSGGGNGDGFPASIATVAPNSVSVGPDGSIYIADSGKQRIRRIDPNSGFIETLAGIGSQGFSGDGGQADVARLSSPSSAVADASGNVYICDQSNNRIRRVAPNGVITTVAGSGVAGYADGPALSGKLYLPYSIALDSAGNLLIAEPYQHRVRYLNVAAGTLSTVAGTGVGGYNGDGIAATQAKLQLPGGVWSLGNGAFLIADQANHRIREVDSSGTISTIAGTGTAGFSGDGGQAKFAQLSSPIAVSARADGTIAIIDSGNVRLRVVSPTGIISTAAGTGTAGYNGDSIAGAQAQLNGPLGVAFTAQADCLIADLDNDRVRSLNNCTANGAITTITGVSASFTADGWPAAAGILSTPSDALVDASGVIYIADSTGNRIRRIGSDGIIQTVAGTGQAGFFGDGGAATQAKLSQPYRLAFDLLGNLLVLDTGNRRVRRVNASDGTIATIAGTGASGSTGDNGPATSATFQLPLGLATDGAGRTYIADASGRRVRMIDQTGRISTIAGTGVATGSIDGPGGNPADDLGDGGPATSATFIAPSDVTVDSVGNVYVTDMSAHLLRQIDTNGIIRTIAGTGTGTGSIDGPGGNPADDLGDGGAATRATLNSPVGVFVTPAGDIYIADQANRRIRVIHNGIINTLGGNGIVTWSIDGEGGDPRDDLGDGGAVASATFITVTSVFVDTQGNLLLTDGQAKRLRQVLNGNPGPSPTNTPPPTPSFTATHIPPTPTQIASTPTRTSIPATPTNTSTPGSANVSVTGNVSYYANAQVKVPSVVVDLTGPQVVAVQTTSTGAYSATSMPAGTWDITPSKRGSFGNGISSLDAARVLQAVAGLITFTPMQRIACDVTGDGTLSALDAQRILQFSAGLINQLPVAQACGSDWAFYPSPGQVPNQQVVPPSISSGNCQAGNIVLNPLVAQASGQDFEAILFGDCTGNWTPTVGAALVQVAQASTTSVQTGPARRAPGHQLLIPIYVREHAPFTALDLQVSFDPSTLTLTSVVPRGSATGAMTGISAESPGTVVVSLANATPIDPSLGVMLVLEFHVSGTVGRNPVEIVQAQVDEQPTTVAAHSIR